jgi:LysR family transcriptional regulator, transcriptional activator of nhaA
LEWLNDHHLLCYWTAARDVSSPRAFEKLYLAQPTISGQLRVVEKFMGDKLFTRLGRRLALTETRRTAYGYAGGIFLQGKCGEPVMGIPEPAKALRLRFPKCRDGVPFILPADNTTLRQSLDQWFNILRRTYEG